MNADTQIRAHDLEQHREQIINEMVAEHGEAWAEEYAPGTFGCHELLDRTFQTAQNLEAHLLSHPACVQNREWFGLAEQALASLLELYQRIGAEHLAEDGK